MKDFIFVFIILTISLFSKAQNEPTSYPDFSFIVDDNMYFSEDALRLISDDVVYFNFNDAITGTIKADTSFRHALKFDVVIENNTADTVIFENMVPFGQVDDHIYITSTGPWALARAKIFRPGKEPISVILPDNAWEVGYGEKVVEPSAHRPAKLRQGICAMARRTAVVNGEKRRYKTDIFPEGKVNYSVYLDRFSGPWQNGLKKMFQEHLLFDVDHFDNRLFDREDLQWIRHQYLIVLQFAWDKQFYDPLDQVYRLDRFLEEGKLLFGGYDVYGIWPTWPRLGIDDRNQWDMFSGMPGGLERIRQISSQMQDEGTKFFICYNPWDQSTRDEDPYKGMARLIEATDANGIVLDCHGWSSEKYQQAADSIKEGVVMYSEGMAVVKDMPGIVAGRVHNAIEMSPVLNLNKLIKPEFAIFRVCEIDDPSIRREVLLAFFNGYGTELNMFAPGRTVSNRADLDLLSRTTMILRENTSCFLSGQWTPAIPAFRDSIWVNYWPHDNKEIYTVYSEIPEGFWGPLFPVNHDPGFHYVSLWHHEELAITESRDNIPSVMVQAGAFNVYDLGTRHEGSIDCLARLPRLIKSGLSGSMLSVEANRGDELKIWYGNPSYQGNYINLNCPVRHELDVYKEGFVESGKLVIQLFENQELLDENIIYLDPTYPYLISAKSETRHPVGLPDGMELVDGGSYHFNSSNPDNFIPYPVHDTTLMVSSFYMDRRPVSNEEYYLFVQSSGYVPEDTNNYLRHWSNGMYPDSLAGEPVVFIDHQDAKAYAEWAGKRLPAEAEWQYAAEHSDKLEGLFGNVWQLTSDIYDNGSYVFVIMKGGSHYQPSSSWWYVQGGSQPADRAQMLLLVSPALNRNSTVGFRCVVDK